jgi:hypothetical protein|tara:strand:- start:11789 stop:12667 length:879 start_codon:yes stop_codon:yes gene_type:complete
MPEAVLITIASWEERFALGVGRSLSQENFTDVVCLVSDRYADETSERRTAARLLASEAGVQYEEWQFDFEDQVECYYKMSALAQERLARADRVVLDISTAPRTLVWMLLGALTPAGREIFIRYSQAAEYDDWQTTEEGEPRLIINRSGIMYPDKPTCLVALCGPEISRAEKMFDRFEPRKTLLLRDPRAANYGEIKRLPNDYGGTVQEIVFDNTDTSDANLSRLEELVQPQIEGHNVVAASLGPKMSAILLFKLSQRYEQVGLSYVVSGQHNLASTSGIGQSTDLTLRLGKK